MAGSEFVCPVNGCDRSFDSLHGRSLHFGKGHSEATKRTCLLEELERLTAELGQSPSVSRMQEHGRFGRDVYEAMFGSWSAALAAAGLDAAPQYEHTREELLAEIQRLADDLGRPPRRNEMREQGAYGSNVYWNRFGSWNDALRAAGFEPYEIHYLDREELLSALHALAAELGRPPTGDDMQEYGAYDPKPYRRVFGSWNAALEEAGFDVHQEKGMSREELLAEVQRLGEELGRTPAAADMTEHGEYSVKTYQQRFGSWNAAIRAANLEPNQTAGYLPPLYGPGWTEAKRQQVRRRDGFACCGCGISQEVHLAEHGEKLHVHHLIPAREYPEKDPRANAVANLVSLCRFCHVRWEHAAGLAPPDATVPDRCDPPQPDDGVTLADYVN